MMKIRNNNARQDVKNINLDMLVPQDHIIRKIDSALDLSFIYEKVKPLYSNTGTNSIDPVVLFKIILIQYLFGIRSMRQIIKEIEVNIAYRWYLGYGLDEKIPHFTTFGKNYQRRFQNTKIFEEIFNEIISEAIKCRFVNIESVFVDGTHIKASANNKKARNVLIEENSKFYQEQLEKEINLDRENHKKKTLNFDKTIKEKRIKQSTTDVECGVFHKGEHKKVFAYSANTACDKNNFVLDFVVNPGNIHDSKAFPELYKKLKNKYSGIKNIVVDAGYKIPAIAKLLIDDNVIPIMPYKRPMTKYGFFKKYEYVYDEFYDCYLCPNDKILKYSTTNREGYREYKSNPKECKNCLLKDKCTESKNSTKIITRHIWEKYIEEVEDIRHREGSSALYSLRSQTIERVFADAKELHGMRYTQYRGLAKLKMELTLKFVSMNLKKLAIWKARNSLFLFILKKKMKRNINFQKIKKTTTNLNLV